MFKISDERMDELKSLTEAHQETSEEYAELCAGGDERKAFHDQSEEAERKFEERSGLRDYQLLVSKRIYQLKAAIAENQQALCELQEELQRKQAEWDSINGTPE